MSEQDKDALRCADLLQDEAGVDGYVHDEAAAHIRRLLAEREKDRDALDKAINVLSAIKAIEDLDLSEYTNLAGQSLAVVVDEAISALTERVGEV